MEEENSRLTQTNVVSKKKYLESNQTIRHFAGIINSWRTKLNTCNIYH